MEQKNAATNTVMILIYGQSEEKDTTCFIVSRPTPTLPSIASSLHHSFKAQRNKSES